LEVPREGKTSEEGEGGKVEDLGGDFEGYTRLPSSLFHPELLDTKVFYIQSCYGCTTPSHVKPFTL
jgi:hypothetical protein